MVDITHICHGSVELELNFLMWLSKNFDVIIKNSKIYIDIKH